MHVLSPDHPQAVLHSMETIMTTVIDESEEVPMDLLEILLAAVKKENQVSFSSCLCHQDFLRFDFLCGRHGVGCLTNGFEACGEGSQ